MHFSLLTLALHLLHLTAALVAPSPNYSPNLNMLVLLSAPDKPSIRAPTDLQSQASS